MSLATYFKRRARTKQSIEQTPSCLRMFRSLGAFASNLGVLLMRCHTLLKTLHKMRRGRPVKLLHVCTLKKSLEKIRERARHIFCDTWTLLLANTIIASGLKGANADEARYSASRISFPEPEINDPKCLYSSTTHTQTDGALESGMTKCSVPRMWDGADDAERWIWDRTMPAFLPRNTTVISVFPFAKLTCKPKNENTVWNVSMTNWTCASC